MPTALYWLLGGAAVFGGYTLYKTRSSGPAATERPADAPSAQPFFIPTGGLAGGLPVMGGLGTPSVQAPAPTPSSSGFETWSPPAVPYQQDVGYQTNVLWADVANKTAAGDVALGSKGFDALMLDSLLGAGLVPSGLFDGGLQAVSDYTGTSASNAAPVKSATMAEAAAYLQSLAKDGISSEEEWAIYDAAKTYGFDEGMVAEAFNRSGVTGSQIGRQDVDAWIRQRGIASLGVARASSVGRDANVSVEPLKVARAAPAKTGTSRNVGSPAQRDAFLKASGKESQMGPLQYTFKSGSNTPGVGSSGFVGPTN